MKSLLLIRHAKSDWGNLGSPDYDRVLNPRGLGDATAMDVEETAIDKLSINLGFRIHF